MRAKQINQYHRPKTDDVTCILASQNSNKQARIAQLGEPTIAQKRATGPTKFGANQYQRQQHNNPISQAKQHNQSD
jgi:hypothetical protein